MTPEEKAVIQAAIALVYGTPESQSDSALLLAAVDALIFACPQCNQGGHTCPGDGESVAHGETDCGKHDEQSYRGLNCLNCDSLVASVTRVDGTEEGEPARDCEHGPRWLSAAFADCLAGDRIRIGQEETVVRQAGTQKWHARNREWTDDAGKTRDHQTPWEHTVLRMDLEANPGMHEYPAGTACEILCDAERKASLLLQQSFPGTSVDK